jgi:hypothetical protein
MTFIDFMSAIRFVRACGENSLLISGGEPTDHPSFHDFLNYAMMNFDGQIFVLSHGGYLRTTEDVDNLVKKYPNVMFQFTSDPLYYKTLIPSDVVSYISHMPNAYVTKDLNATGSTIYPQGRALRMGVTKDSTRSIAAKCFNLRSLLNAGMSLVEGIAMLRIKNKMCTPSINMDATISMGESNECPSVGTTSTDLKTLGNNIKCSQCDDCGMIGKLGSLHKQAIGFRD